ncbi:tyrosine-type recombinase/integrase [Actinomadura sp. NPDC048394]|uniref:tyrosine-type recombinase/integrase n=1 Tax=Actinomadura sp. NPDC048394 TaxID=3158223 RepID=UPI003407601E
MHSGDETLVREYLTRLHLKGRSPRTITEYRRRLTRLADSLEASFQEATPDDLLRWRTGLQHSDTTISAYANTARTFFAWLARTGRIEQSPADDLPIPARRRGIPRPISEDDLDYAIENAPHRIRPWLVLAAYAGLRAQEIAYITRQDLLNTYRPPMIHVSEEMAKGSKEAMVPLIPYVWSELQAYGLPRRGYLFLRARGSGPNSPKTVSNIASEYLHECGFDETLHQLRHFFGTSVLETSGGNIRVAQEALRHSSVSSTMVYTAVQPRDAVRAVLLIQPQERRRRRAAEGGG